MLLLLVYQGLQFFKEELRLPPHLQREIPWQVVGIVAGLAVLLLVLRAGVGALSDRQLLGQVTDLSREIVAFADERNQVRPPEGQPNWDEYPRRLIKFSAETRGLYAQRFAERTRVARLELERRGLVDKDLDQWSDRPADPLVIRALGEYLEHLARKLQ